MMVLDEFKHASLITRERGRDREREGGEGKRDSCIAFRDKKHSAIEWLAPDVDVSKF